MTTITLGQLAVQAASILGPGSADWWFAKCPNCGGVLESGSQLGVARLLGRHAREVSQCGAAIYRKLGVTE